MLLNVQFGNSKFDKIGMTVKLLSQKQTLKLGQKRGVKTLPPYGSVESVQPNRQSFVPKETSGGARESYK
jgi:hypothetical protein